MRFELRQGNAGWSVAQVGWVLISGDNCDVMNESEIAQARQPRRRGRASYRQDLKAIDRAVGGRVRQRRIMMGLSQTALADSVGLTFQQVQKYESGANRISASRLYEFGDVLSVPISYFFDDMEEPEAGSPQGIAIGLAEGADQFNHDPMAKRETLELVRSYYKITDAKVRKRVFELVKALGKSGRDD